MDEHTFTLVLVAVGWVAATVGWLFLRSVWRVDKAIEKLDRIDRESDRTILAVHFIEDHLDLKRTTIRDPIRD